MLYFRVEGFTAFEPNCTVPNHTVSYVGPPTIQGSLQLVRACISVLVASVYTFLHYNLPFSSRQLDGFSDKFRRWLECEVYVVPGLAVLAPELVYAPALIDCSMHGYGLKSCVSNRNRRTLLG